MGEAASPLRASKDPTSSGLLQWRWPGTTVPMGAAPMRCIGAEGNRDTAFSTGWGVRTPPFPPSPPPHPSAAAACRRETRQSRRLMMSLQSTNRFLLRLHGWDIISR